MKEYVFSYGSASFSFFVIVSNLQDSRKLYWKTIQLGVPQGSILEPLLFNQFINDLAYSVDDAKLRLYADDTLYLSHPNQDVLESRSQSKFDVLQSLFKCNYLSINKSKTKVLPFGDNPPFYELFADRTRPPLEVVHDMKLLGLTIDSSA